MVYFVFRYRNYFAIGLSALLLAGVMLAWPQVFLFAKSAFLPRWTHYIDPMVLFFLCLIPAALLTTSVRQALDSLLGLVLLLPVVPLFSYVMSHDFDGYGNLLINVVMQYLWIVIMSFLAPAIVLLLLRLAYAWSKTYFIRGHR